MLPTTFGLKSLTIRQVVNNLATICEPALGGLPVIHGQIVKYTGMPAKRVSLWPFTTFAQTIQRILVLRIFARSDSSDMQIKSFTQSVSPDDVSQR